jgi:hypothetical protein
MSATRENSAKRPLAVTQKDKALSTKFARARAGARGHISLVVGPT